MDGPLLRAFRREVAWLRASPWDLGLITIGPLATLVVLGWMFLASAARQLPVVYVDQDHSTVSRQLGRNLQASPQIKVVAEAADMQAAWRMIRAGEVWAIVYAPEHTEREVLAGREATVFVYDNAAFYSLGALSALGATSAIQALTPEIAPELARTRGIPLARISVPNVQSTVLFNPQLSYEWFLESLLQPGVLHLMMSCAVMMAVGREFRDRTLTDWIARPKEVAAGLAGKLAPYVLVFTAWNLLGVGWLCGVRGWGVHGDLLVLSFAVFLLYAAYAAIAALISAIVRDIATGLSAAAVYGGPAITFSNATLPTIDAPIFTQVWSRALPYTAYIELQMEQMFMGSPAAASLTPLLTLVGFAVGSFLIAWLLLGWRVRQASSAAVAEAGLPQEAGG